MPSAPDAAGTFDRAPEVLAAEQIGRTRYLTPEGYLLCEGARIARVGPMLYRPDEVPDIEPAGAGMVTVTRDPDVLFAEETIASFLGKPVTNDHPPDFVRPETFRTYCVGTTLNPRRGEGVEADYLLGDLLITDAGAIADVLSGKMELSPGYSAPRQQVRPGLARQTAIIGNHVALVARGRGGPACAIQDEKPDTTQTTVEGPMAKKRSVFDRLMTAFKANDEAAFKEELEAAQDEMEGDEPQKLVIEVKQPENGEKAEEKAVDEGNDPVAAALTKIGAALEAFGARLDKLESGKTADEEQGQEEKDGDKSEDEHGEEAEFKSMDAAAIRDAFADARARAEILAPGITLPTLDAKAEPRALGASIRDIRVKALSAAMAKDASKAHISTVLAGRKPEFQTMTADALATIFVASSELAKAANRPNARIGALPQGPMTPAKYAEMLKAKRKA